MKKCRDIPRRPPSMSSFLTKPISLPRPRRPELRRPELHRAKGGRPTLGGPELSLPSFRRKRSSGGTLVGLQIEAGSVAAVEARLDGGVARVTAAGVEPLSPDAFRDGEVAEPEAVTAALRTLVGDHGLGRKVRLGIANQRLVVRTLRLPAIENPDDLDAAVRFSAQEQIAMPLEDAVIEHRVVGGAPAEADAPAQVDVMVIAARRDMIRASLAPLRAAGLEPVGVDLSAFGMIRALADAGVAVDAPAGDGTPSQGATLYCNIGDSTNLAVARARACLFTRLSSVGLAEIAGNLSSAAGLSLEHAAMWLDHVGLRRPLTEIEGDEATVAHSRAALEHGAAQLVDELRLSLDFYAAQEAAVAIEKIVLCGPGAAIPGFAEEMAPQLGLPIAVGLPEALSGYPAPVAARLTLPFGIALDT